MTKLGESVGRFISEIDTLDFVIAVGTPQYLEKYRNQTSSEGNVVAAEVDLLNQRLLSTERMKATVLPLLLVGTERESFPPLLRGRVYADFREERMYFGQLFDIVLTIHGIPRTEPGIRELLRGLGHKHLEEILGIDLGER